METLHKECLVFIGSQMVTIIISQKRLHKETMPVLVGWEADQ